MLTHIRFGRLALVGTLSVAAAAGAPLAGAQGALAVSPSLYSGLSWRCIGPFDGGPVASVTGVAGQAGVYVITTPSGGAWKTSDGGDTWVSIDHQGVPAPAGDPPRWIDPANPRRIVRTDDRGVEVSLDEGRTWVASHHLAIAEVARVEPREHQTEPPAARRNIDGKPVNVSLADPARPGLVFAGTDDSVYVSFDNGLRWESLRLNLPAARINDLDIRGNNLVAATQGRSVWQLDDITPLRQLGATGASAPVILFKPADAVRRRPGSSDAGGASSPAGVNLDYYLGASQNGAVTLEILDAGGRVVHQATSAVPDATDRWLPVMRPLSATPGHHRVVWNLRLDPPPAQKHRYAQLARALFEDTPADPDGPVVLPGTYRVRLTAGGRAYVQPLVVHNDAAVGDAPATLASERRQFDLAMKIYDAMRTAHREFLQLGRVRAQLRPMLQSADPDVALAAADLDARLVNLDGSDWTDLVIPDEDQDDFDPDEAEEQGIKHPDFVPPKPVSISKDYDDPTSILGRRFASVDHAPALAPVSAALGGMLARAEVVADTPDATVAADYERSCQQLSGVLDAWRVLNAQDLPRVNAELARRGLPRLPIATTISAIGCAVR